MNRPDPRSESTRGGLTFSALGDVRILGRLGEGGRSTVYHGDWKGREVAVKLYKAGAIARHARKHRQGIAEYEYSRNLEFYEAPGMSLYTAQPLGLLVNAGVSAMIQEKLDGQLYYFYYRQRNGRVPPKLAEHLASIIRLSHEAKLYDVDMHAMNVMVVEGRDGEPIPKLFDFNLIPFNAKPPNPFVALLLKTGLMSVRSRDLRMLRNFHNFRRYERKLLKYYHTG